MEELVKFTLVVRDRDAVLTDRYSERKATGLAEAATLAATAMANEQAAE